MALTLEYEDNNLVVVRVSDVLGKSEADEVKRQIADFVTRQGRINILITIENGFSNLETFVSWDDNDDDKFIQQHVTRIAIVGNLRWRDSATLFLLGGYLPFPIEYFTSDQEDFAKAWLTA